MGLIDGYAKTLRNLRTKARLPREELAKRCRIAEGTLGRIEHEVGPQNLETLAQALAPLNVTLSRFAAAMASERGEVAGGVVGRARLVWVAQLVREAIDSRLLSGMAISALGDLAAGRDLIASAEAAAEQLARQAIDDVSGTRAVAEPLREYDVRRKGDW